jgi:hypothetical protein
MQWKKSLGQGPGNKNGDDDPAEINLYLKTQQRKQFDAFPKHQRPPVF